MSAMQRAMRLLGGEPADPQLQQAAWVARCVGRGDSAPLTGADVSALAATLHRRSVAHGALAFGPDDASPGVWIVRSGRLELATGRGTNRVVVQILHPGDVDGDIPLLLDMPMPYTARAVEDTELLFLTGSDFEQLLSTHAPIARRWLSSVAQRLSASHMRILGLLGRTLSQQTAQLLLDEAADGSVALPQHTLAAMLGVRRPSLNKVLKELERARVISVSYAAITILDPDALATRASP
ncbi:Crp/Fnr family transcriptional regulator [Lipingzhangella sp. LS1_29]|uniref:Crp/Fnr family transcriptional regulator n=1 Tax=Lipingzhangella rawalii TaxID=2055835 RepID=A0ABU2HAF4_9ACTN|nr:Crp/Fnr family transcriptional regulator [Lipingzhangella rawalii]MDS1271854.1 Crp/Fnr family transcriptional regulator [Lipingzhangella rawalii]